MAGAQRLISWFHRCSTSNVELNTRTWAHGPLMGHPNWAGCDRNEREETMVALEFYTDRERGKGKRKGSAVGGLAIDGRRALRVMGE
jgi:hypothetical protein